MKGHKIQKKAQALLELAIFGIIFLIFLGLLITYGLKFNYRQQIEQTAFRKALAVAGKRGKVDYIYTTDRRIPNPSESFATGDVLPVVSSISITRDYQMQETADRIDELPAVAVDIKGSKCPQPGSGGPPGAPLCNGKNGDNCQLSPAGTDPPCFFLTAGFRDEDLSQYEECEKEKKVDKYYFIYGNYNVDVVKVRKLFDSGTTDEGGGIVWHRKEIIDHVRVIDSCDGEILSYSSCKIQCKMITDNQFCMKECKSGGGSRCSQVCNTEIETPWYCGKLDSLFDFAKDFSEKYKSMGVQFTKYIQTTKRNNALNKVESPEGITTIDTFDWSDIISRSLIFRQYGDRSGKTAKVVLNGVLVDPEIISVVSEKYQAEPWESPWPNE